MSAKRNIRECKITNMEGRKNYGLLVQNYNRD